MSEKQENKIHHGDIIRKAISLSGYSVTEVAKRVGTGRENMYRWFGKQRIDPYLILRIGKAIDHDFTSEMGEKEFASILNEPESVYETLELKAKRLEKELELMKKQCFQLMDENKLLLSNKLQEYFLRFGPIKA